MKKNKILIFFTVALDLLPMQSFAQWEILQEPTYEPGNKVPSVGRIKNK